MATATPAVELGPLGLENPMGTDGFEFVEYTAPDIELLRSLFTKMGFPEVARHKSKDVTLHKQADCNFIINAEPGSYAEDYANAHGPSACAMAFRVKDAKAAHERALRLGATNVQVSRGDGELGFELADVSGASQPAAAEGRRNGVDVVLADGGPEERDSHLIHGASVSAAQPAKFAPPAGDRAGAVGCVHRRGGRERQQRIRAGAGRCNDTSPFAR